MVRYFDNFKQYSASTVARDHRSLYDSFHFPCSSNTYIPNERLRMLRDSIANGVFEMGLVEECELRLQDKLLSLQSWEYPIGGSESQLLDLHVNPLIIDEICTLCKTLYNTAVVMQKDALPFSPILCKNAKSEYRLDLRSHGHDFVVFASECKGVDASHFNCLIQGLQMASDASIYMRRHTNSDPSDCSTPGVIVYADIVQFFGVYLVDDFPVVVFLSPPLTYTNIEGRRQISRALFSCAKYIHESAQLLANVQYTGAQPLRFDIKKLFFKLMRNSPKDDSDMVASNLISNVCSSIDRMMYVYGKIAVIEECVRYIAFPIGLMRIPTKDPDDAFAAVIEQVNIYFRTTPTPRSSLVVFPFLHGWRNDRPPPSHTDQYIEQLTRAIDILNAAEVAHMDLYPSNIMWQISSDNNLEMQIIDFEDAVLFGSKVMFIEILKRDLRYPPMEARALQFASKYHNMWYLVCVSSWLKESEPDTDFSEFMRLHYKDISQQVLNDYV